MAELSPRRRYVARLAALKNERSSWLEHWRELNDYITPRRGRFLASDRNKGTKKNDKVINGTARRAARILSSGMMAGITSPARPWFRLTTPDPSLAEVGSVRQWLHVVEERIRLSMAKSNLYNALHNVYEDLATPGTSAMVVEEDPEDLLRAYVLPTGQYCLAQSSRLQVDTLYRELSMTVGQLVERFGIERCSVTVQNQYKQGAVDDWRDVIHVIEPNRSYETGKLGPRGMRWRSVWMEAGGDERLGFLGEGGFQDFPVMAPRWAVTGEDVYGSSPGMDALGDVKALQLLERRKAQAVDKVVTPPMKGPATLRNTRVGLLPGETTYVDSTMPSTTFEPAVIIPPTAVQLIDQLIQRHEERINGSFYADLWLMLAQNERQVTAREVSERHEEKMLQLGPVLERLQRELLDPLVDRVFGILLRSGQLPPPPEELSGIDLRVEYISVMAQAQKLLGITGIERLASFVGNIAAVKPDILDKVNWDEVVDEYAASLGTKPDLTVPDDQVAAVRAERAERQQQQQAAETAMAAADGAKTLSETDMQGDSALNRLVGSLGGVAGAAGGAA